MARMGRFRKGRGARKATLSLRFTGSATQAKGPPAGEGLFAGPTGGLLLQLPLQDFNLVGQHSIVANEPFNLSNGVQHGGVITAAESASYFRQ